MAEKYFSVRTDLKSEPLITILRQFELFHLKNIHSDPLFEPPPLTEVVQIEVVTMYIFRQIYMYS